VAVVSMMLMLGYGCGCCGTGVRGALRIRAGDRVRTGDVQLGRLTLYQLSYSREVMVIVSALSGTVEGDGFEPSKA
jgi:hypothetical protein